MDDRITTYRKQVEHWPEGYCLFPFSGKCYSCGEDIIANHKTKVEQERVTGCPSCHRSIVS